MKRLLLLLALSGCTHSIHLVHTSGFSPYSDKESGKPVSSRSEQFVILSLVGNTDYVEEAYQNLIKQCPKGSIKGITTQYSTSHGFFSWTNKIFMQGTCVGNS